MSVTHPALLWLAIPCGFVLVLALELRRRRLRKVVLELGGPGAPMGRIVRGADGPGTHRIRGSLLFAAGVGLALAAAGPRGAIGAPGVEEGGAGTPPTLVLAVDVSRSMAVTDVAPDRMTAARLLALRIAAELPEARIGLVAFAAQAQVLLPPTTDRAILVDHLAALDPGLVREQGSSVHGAIDASLGLLAADGAGAARPGAALVIFSDGELHDEPADAVAEARRARDEGVRVWAFTVGTEEGGPVPGVPGARSVSRPDHLADIAGAGGGTAWRPAGISDAVVRLSASPRDPGGESAEGRPGGRPFHAFPLGLALSCLLLEGVLPGRWRRAPRHRGTK